MRHRYFYLAAVIYKKDEPSATGLSFVDVLTETRGVVKKKGFTQVSRRLRVEAIFLSHLKEAHLHLDSSTEFESLH